MKHIVLIGFFSLLVSGCTTEVETAKKPENSNGFVSNYEDYSWHISGQASVDLVVDLDKVWGKDYAAMRTFFSDTASFSFAEGELYNSVDGFIEHVKDQMEENAGWTMDYAFAVDIAPGEGGDWVNAAYTVDATKSEPKRVIYEWYYVRDGKIQNFLQSKRVVFE